MRQLRNADGGERWDFCAGVLPRGINPTDIDLAIEAGGRFLILEGKRPGEEIPKGQGYFLDRIATQPFVTVMHFEGNPPADITRYALWRQPLQPTTTEDFNGVIRQWFDWAERLAA